MSRLPTLRSKHDERRAFEVVPHDRSDVGAVRGQPGRDRRRRLARLQAAGVAEHGQGPRRRHGVEALEQRPRLRLADPQVVVVRRRRGLAGGHRDADGQPRIESGRAEPRVPRPRGAAPRGSPGRWLPRHRSGRACRASRRCRRRRGRRPPATTPCHRNRRRRRLRGRRPRAARRRRCSRSSRCGSPAAAGRRGAGPRGLRSAPAPARPGRGGAGSSNRPSSRAIQGVPVRSQENGRRIAPCENPSNPRFTSPTRRPRLSRSASVCGFTFARTSPGTHVSILTRCWPSSGRGHPNDRVSARRPADPGNGQ